MGRKNKTKERTKLKPPAEGSRSDGTPSPGAKPAGPRQLGLQLLVFVAGAVLMGLEIAGSRVLAPHFGNSVFVWGSLISVFLMALSLGYYLGGRLADRYPSHILLNSICAVVALMIFGLALVAYPVCESLVAGGLGEQSGPLITSMLLFLPPSVGMGMVSPFAVRLATQSVTSVGKSAGTLYALSTLGSIAGTLFTTFVLIPLLGLTLILKGLGLALLLAAVFTLPLRKLRQVPAVLIALLVVTLGFLFLPGPARTPLRRGDKVIVDVDTPYHHISVVDNGKAREMRFDRFVESSIINDPEHRYRSLSDYTDYFHLALLAQPDVERALFIGAGGGVGPRAFHMHDPDMAIDVVDIDPKVLELAQTHFHLEDVPHIRTIAQDGRQFVRQAEDQYDCIFLDAFTIGGRIPFHLVTTEFLQLCRDKMTENGAFVMNINSAVDGPRARIFHSMFRTIQSVFPNIYVFAKDRRLWSENQSRNIILLAVNGQQRLDSEQWSERANGHESDSYVESSEMRQMVQDLLVDLPDVSRAPVFTDDYAPIETMPF